jgi:biopolymer transport protein ExbD
MVSLADIAFLIIFFFMFSSQFMRDATQIDVPIIPESEKSNSAINVSMDADKKLYLDGQEVDSKEMLEDQLKSMLAGKTEPKELEVRLKCDRNLVYKDYKVAYEAISNAGGVIAVIHELTPK